MIDDETFSKVKNVHYLTLLDAHSNCMILQLSVMFDTNTFINFGFTCTQIETILMKVGMERSFVNMGMDDSLLIQKLKSIIENQLISKQKRE